MGGKAGDQFEFQLGQESWRTPLGFSACHFGKKCNKLKMKAHWPQGYRSKDL
jgi:hypothetical protein